MSATAFKELLGKSCGAENQRTKSSAKPADRFDGLGKPGLNIHGDGGRGTDTEAVCKDCSSKFCPKSRRTDAQCDVYGTPTEWRVTRVPPFAQGPLNEKRVAAGKPPIVFPAKPSVNAATVDTPPAAVSDADAMRAANAESQAKIDAFMAHGLKPFHRRLPRAIAAWPHRVSLVPLFPRMGQAELVALGSGEVEA